MHWGFTTFLSEQDTLWVDSRVPTSSAGTMLIYSVVRIPEIAAALKQINGKPVRVYLADLVESKLKPLSGGGTDEDDLDWYAEVVCREGLQEWITKHFNREAISDLYDLYVEKVRAPAEKRRRDFFVSSTATSETPAGPQDTSSSSES